MDSKLIFYICLQLFGDPNQYKIDSWSNMEPIAHKGPQEIPRVHFRLIVGCMLEDLLCYMGGIFENKFEVFWENSFFLRCLRCLGGIL